MGFTLRIAGPDDATEVGQVTVEAYTEDGFLALEADYADELRDAASRLRHAEVWLAEDELGVVGSVTYCRPGTPFAELARAGEGEFRMLGVVSRARRRGVAEALVVRCIERSKELGYDAVVLCSMKEMDAAHRLYNRLGFRRLPERDWSPAAGVDLIAFTRPVR